MAASPDTLGMRALRDFFRRVVSLYFRAVDVGGDVPVPKTGGRIFFANHHNGLVDPLLVVTAIGCPVSPIAKSTLWKIPGLRTILDVARAVPVARKQDAKEGANPTDNDAMFEAVGKHLAQGGNMLIFPEGISHNDPHVVKLKTGAARMLVRAEAEGGTFSNALTYQAVSIDFDARDTFRSRAFLLFGPPRRVADIPDGEGRVRAIVEQMQSDLDALYLDAPTWDERKLLLAVAELYAPPHARALGEIVPLAKQVQHARNLLHGRDPEWARTLAKDVETYRDALESAHVQDAYIAGEGSQPPTSIPRSLGKLLLAPFALVASILYLIPYQVPRLAAHLTKGTADVRSTYKIGAGLVAFPVWALGLAGAAMATFHGVALLGALAVIFGSPFAALRWIDRADAYGGALLPDISDHERSDLAKMRAALRERLDLAHEAVQEDAADALRSDEA